MSIYFFIGQKQFLKDIRRIGCLSSNPTANLRSLKFHIDIRDFFISLM